MVDIHITGVHCHISDRVKAHISEKLGSLTKYNSRLSSLHVTISEAEKHGFRIVVDMHLPSGKDVVAHDEEETVFSAIDVVAAKCAAQLRRIHSRQMEPQRQRA